MLVLMWASHGIIPGAHLGVAVSVIFLGSAITGGCGGGNSNINQTSITCPAGRTLLDGVCVNEQVADYVACVRAQGASLGAGRAEKLSAEAGTVGVRAGAAHEVTDRLEKKYSVSEGAELEIVRACASRASVAAETPGQHSSKTATACEPKVTFSGFAQSFKCPDDRDVQRLGDRGSKEACLEACTRAAHDSKAVGCWYLDGTNGFSRDCRSCLTMIPVKDQYANDWAGALSVTPCK